MQPMPPQCIVQYVSYKFAYFIVFDLLPLYHRLYSVQARGVDNYNANDPRMGVVCLPKRGN